MKEKDFENKVKAFLMKNNIWALKTWSNGIQRQGIPDLLCCINGFFVAVELKAERGKPSKLQNWNIEKIRESLINFEDVIKNIKPRNSKTKRARNE